MGVWFSEAIGGVSNVAIAKSGPVERSVLSSWEQRHGVLLPADLRRFYLAVDGFNLTWDYQYGGRLLPGVGRMHVNPIADVKRLSAMGTDGSDSTPPPLALPPPLPARPSPGEADERLNVMPVKAFEIDSCRGAAKICLVASSGVWLLDRAFEWHPLATDFTCYFRIMLVHLGLPLWQFRFTPMGLTPWAEQLASLVAPHLLQSAPVVSASPLASDSLPTYSQLDPAVFKSNTRSRTRNKDQ